MVPVLAALVGYVANGVGSALLAALVGIVGWLVLVGVASIVVAPNEVDQKTRAERDDAARERDRALALLDRRAVIAAGLEEFRVRLDEGNVLARSLKHVPVINAAPLVERNAARAAQRIEYRDHVRAWNAACRATVRTYLPHREPLMDRPLATLDKAGWQALLAHEVATKIQWMSDIQRELEAQSISSAISSQLQT